MLPDESQFAVPNDSTLSYEIYRYRKDEDIRLPDQMGKRTGKHIRDLFYVQSEEDMTVWICKCKTRRKQAHSGYTNLVRHVSKQHPLEYTALKREIETGTSVNTTNSSQQFFYSRKTQSLFGWMDLIGNRVLSLYVCENELHRGHMKHQPTTYKTIKRYMSQLTKIVELKFRKLCLKRSQLFSMVG